jgi:hypothetical protein
VNKRGFVLLALAVITACCGGLYVVTDVGRLQNLRGLGEVTAVVDGDRPGTVMVHSQLDAHDDSWRVDDRGEILDWADDTGTTAREPRVRQCVGTVCYRVPTTALRVEVSTDGGTTYTTSWEVGGDTYTRLATTYPDVGDPAEHLSSRSLVVHPVPGGHVVFVANRRDGLLYRDVHGVWLRLGFPSSGEGCCFYAPPLPIAADPQPFDPTNLAVVVVVLAVMLSGGVAVILRSRWTDLPGVVVLAALAGYGTALAGHFPAAGMFPGWMCGVPVILVILIGGIVLAPLFVIGWPARHNRLRAGP